MSFWEYVAPWFSVRFEQTSPEKFKRSFVITALFPLFSQLLDFIQTVNKGGPLSWTVQQSIEKVKENIQWRKTNENDVESWLKDFFAKKSKKDTDDGFTDPAK